jgi:hypothetical protein
VHLTAEQIEAFKKMKLEELHRRMNNLQFLNYASELIIEIMDECFTDPTEASKKLTKKKIDLHNSKVELAVMATLSLQKELQSRG